MVTRTPPPSPEALRRAVHLSSLPGVTLAEASRRTGVSLSRLRRASREQAVRPTRDDLLLASLTRNFTELEGELRNLEGIASWLDYVNKDGSTAEDVARDLERLADEGWLVLGAGRFRLLREWPK